MEPSKIKNLVEAFYNGQTSQEEEQILYDYFNSNNIAEELLREKELFLQIYDTDTINIPDNLESDLNNLIDILNEEEKARKGYHKRRLWIQLGSIAATVAILICAVYFNRKPEISDDIPASVTLSVEDQQKIQEAQKALILLSSNFNKGIDQLSVVSTNFDKTNEILNKTFNRKKHENKNNTH
ncbi:MAG: hypothetical protein LBV43_00990 [Prevotella sp.]|jgi:hypothetical protein|nr:hypothetical protein [Prevotella sp.]